MSTMVNIRMTDEEIAYLDANFKSRAEGIRSGLSLLMAPAVPRETNHKPSAETQATDDCHHPITRRIGNYCAACGKDNLK